MVPGRPSVPLLSRRDFVLWSNRERIISLSPCFMLTCEISSDLFPGQEAGGSRTCKSSTGNVTKRRPIAASATHRTLFQTSCQRTLRSEEENISQSCWPPKSSTTQRNTDRTQSVASFYCETWSRETAHVSRNSPPFSFFLHSARGRLPARNDPLCKSTRRASLADRESNEIRYLKQATELIEKWQLLLQGVQPATAQTFEHEEVVLVERQR